MPKPAANVCRLALTLISNSMGPLIGGVFTQKASWCAVSALLATSPGRGLTRPVGSLQALGLLGQPGAFLPAPRLRPFRRSRFA